MEWQEASDKMVVGTWGSRVCTAQMVACRHDWLTAAMVDVVKLASRTDGWQGVNVGENRHGVI